MKFGPVLTAVVVAALGLLPRPGQGQVPLRLDPLSAAGSAQLDYRISGDGEAVIYRALDPNDPQRSGLFRLPIEGGIPSKLSGAFGTVGNFHDWQLSQDGSIVFWASEPGQRQREVFRAAQSGDSPLKLNSPLVDLGSTAGAIVGNRVVYIASERTGDFTGTFYELFSVPLSGGPVTRINGDLPSGGDVEKVVARDGFDRVVYLADQEVNDTRELFAVSIAGGTPIKLSANLTLNGTVLHEGLQISPTGNRVMYAADQEQDSVYEIFSVSIHGGAVTKLNGALTISGDVTPGSQLFSPDGSRVIYHADQIQDEVFELFSVPATGGTPVRLNGPLSQGGDVRTGGIQFSPGSDRVLYTADQESDQVFELYSVASQGGVAIRLNGSLVAGGDVADDATFSFDGSRVLYRADQRFDDVEELFSVASLGGTPVRLNPDLGIGGDVVKAAFSPDGSQVVYLADANVDGVFELFAVASSGGDARRINGPLINGGDVIDWRFSPDGKTLVYRADQEVDDRFELFAVSFAESLNGDFNLDGLVDAADFTYWREQLANGNGSSEKYAAWKSGFGRKSGGGPSAVAGPAVPEPATCVLLGGAMLVMIRRGRRR